MIPSLDPFSNGPPFPNLLTNTSPTAWPTFQRLPETKNRLRIRTVGLEKTTRFYQASTSELYGMVQEVPQKASWCRTMDSLVGSTYRETFGFAWVVDFSGWVIFQRFIWFSPWIFPELLGEMIPILTIQYFSAPTRYCFAYCRWQLLHACGAEPNRYEARDLEDF